MNTMSQQLTFSPEKKKVLIHIGMGRCGSSSIQHALMIGRTELASLGIYYPETFPGEVAQHVLGLLTDDKYEEAKEGWRNVLSGFDKSHCTTLLVSTENFIGISPKLFKSIQRLLSGYSVEVIFIIKKHKELLPSIFSQWIKSGIAFQSFEHFYSVTKQEWHYTRIIERWSEAYGADNIKCGILRSGSDAVEIFADCCGVGEMRTMLKNTQIRINASMNPKLLLLIMLFDRFNSRNKIGSVFPGWNHIEPSCPDRNSGIRSRLLGFLEKQNKGASHKGRWKLTRGMEAKIASEYLETNERFYAIYLKGKNKDVVDSKK